jgi:hypothetical protein
MAPIRPFRPPTTQPRVCLTLTPKFTTPQINIPHILIGTHPLILSIHPFHKNCRVQTETNFRNLDSYFLFCPTLHSNFQHIKFLSHRASSLNKKHVPSENFFVSHRSASHLTILRLSTSICEAITTNTMVINYCTRSSLIH